MQEALRDQNSLILLHKPKIHNYPIIVRLDLLLDKMNRLHTITFSLIHFPLRPLLRLALLADAFT
jgi:hypothetical protein